MCGFQTIVARNASNPLVFTSLTQRVNFLRQNLPTFFVSLLPTRLRIPTEHLHEICQMTTNSHVIGVSCNKPLLFLSISLVNFRSIDESSIVSNHSEMGDSCYAWSILCQGVFFFSQLFIRFTKMLQQTTYMEMELRRISLFDDYRRCRVVTPREGTNRGVENLVVK